ncbi:MAG: hypothetical protein DWQ31_14580 [Planctomycetota bacterium]|nr:MAG: hypothetical protein DWQ31_14580 [Planctomycetota bacterium]REJ90606.1 MAG: hypothetical protein DWQ35_16145 [Planctomycetota bacterium]
MPGTCLPRQCRGTYAAAMTQEQRIRQVDQPRYLRAGRRTRLVAIIFMGAVVLLAGCHATSEPETKDPPRPPNIVVFLTDDQGWGDLGCYGHPIIQSPHLDRFAQQGLRLTQCYAASAVCSPSRSAILTGRTPYRNGVFRWIPQDSDIHLRRSEITIATLLKEQGYATCHVGKWHLNGHFNRPTQPQPSDHGYDWWLATQNNARPSHKNPVNFVRNGEEVGPLEGYSAILIAEEAIGWLREHRPADRPFFLTVWTHEPHDPIESDPQFMDRYTEVDDEGVRQHHGNITQLDEAFGMLMRTLDELQLAEETLVIYTADNGPEGREIKGRHQGSTGGLRGRKRSVYEGGIRVPGLVRWPGHIEPGSVSDKPVIGSDIFATLCDVVDIPLPADRVIDGASFAPLFTSDEITRPRPLYWRCRISPEPVKVAMRIGNDKILADPELTRFELYDIAVDPQETTDLAQQRPEKLAELKQRLTELKAEIEAEGPDWWRAPKTE